MILTAPVNNIPTKQLYLIHGNDEWQLIDAVKKINTKFSETKKYYFANFSQFIQFNQTNKSELLNRDLFCISDPKINKIIEISIGNAKFTKQQIEQLNVFLNNFASINNLVIILIGNKLNKAALNSKWFAVINKIGVIIITKSLSTASQQSWAANQFKQANLLITEEALIKFTNMYHNNLTSASQSIQKLAVIFRNTNNPIDLNNLSELICEDPKYSIFDLKNALSRKNIEQIILVLNNLQKQNQEEVLILWSIIQEIKNFLSKTSSLRIKSKIYGFFAKASEIDLSIKNIDMIGVNNYKYIWSLIIDLCLDMSNNI